MTFDLFELTANYIKRSESTQDKAETLPPASRDYVMLFAIFLKRLKLFFESTEFQK